MIFGPHPKPGRRREQSGAKLVVDGAENNDPTPGGASLAGIAERRKKGPANRFVEIGVIADHQRVLAPQLERKFCQAPARLDGNLASDRAGASETDHTDVGIRHQGRPGLGAEAVDDIEHAVRQACFPRDPPEQGGGLRGILRRFENGGISADEGRKDLPRHVGNRCVGGDNQAGHSDGLPHRHREPVGDRW